MPHNTRTGTFWILWLLCGTFVAPVSAQDADSVSAAAEAETQSLLFQAEDLLGNGHFQRAYELLSQEEERLAGDPLFDYLLGVAALDSGRFSEAIFSLQRSLAVEPTFSGARMELARVYYEAGRPGLARPLFVQLLDENPPPMVRSVLNNYISAIDAAPVVPKSQLNAFANMNLGYDNNANGSTDNQQFLGFTLSPENVETSSSFLELGTGFE